MELSCWNGFGKLVGRRNFCGFNGLTDLLGDPGQDQQEQTGKSQALVPLDGSLERLLELLPESGRGGRSLQDYWRTFGTLDLRSLLERKHWSLDDWRVLEEVRSRCMRATFPFCVAEQLLQDSRWNHMTDPRTAGRNITSSLATTEAFRAERTCGQWNTLQAVKNLLGQLSIPSPTLSEIQTDIRQRRERYMTQVRVFSIIVAMFERLGRKHMRLRSMESLSFSEDWAEACTDYVQTFLAVQQVLRSARDPIAEELLRSLKVSHSESTLLQKRH